MATSARHAKTTARRVADRGPLRLLAPAGLLARGLMYIVIGWIALRVAFGKSSQAADRSGALHALGGTPFGAVALWVLVIGFFGMALWQLSEALFGSPSGGQQAGTRCARSRRRRAAPGCWLSSRSAHHFRRVLVLRGPLGAGREIYVHNVRRI